jgi:hypothetical protein
MARSAKAAIFIAIHVQMAHIMLFRTLIVGLLASLMLSQTGNAAVSPEDTSAWIGIISDIKYG